MLKSLSVTFVCCLLLTACSGGEEEQTARETAQERLGHELAEEIKAPINKAEDVQNVVDDHMENLDRQVEEQTQ